MTTDNVLEIVEITPEQAERYLAATPEFQRRISDKQVDRFARDMRAGNWGISNDAITVTTSGVLINGQHRMSAVAQAMVPVEFSRLTIADNAAETMYARIDQGRARSLADVMAADGHTDTNNLVAIAAACWRYGRNERAEDISRNEIRPSVPELREWLKVSDLTEAVRFHRQARKQIRTSTLDAALFQVTNERCPEAASDFWKRVLTGDTSFHSGAWWLRDRRLRQMADRDTTSNRQRVAEAVLCWNAHAEDRSIGVLKFAAKQDFPQITTTTDLG